MNTKQFLSLLATAATGTVLSATSARALTFDYNPTNSSPGEFHYDITLADGETLNIGDPLVLTGLGGVSGVESDRNADLKFSNSSDSRSANFSTTDAASGGATGTTFPNAVILTSSGTLGTINYSGSFNSPGGTFSGTTQGPVTAVPFEAEANLGIFALLGVFGFNHYRKKFKSPK